MSGVGSREAEGGGRALPIRSNAEILAVNTAYEQTITLANTDPYGAGWLVKVRLLDPQAARAELITGEAAVAHFQQRIRDNQIRCYRCFLSNEWRYMKGGLRQSEAVKIHADVYLLEAAHVG